MKMLNFILILITILVILKIFFEKKEKFDSQLQFQSDKGLYNYFFQSYMNPYPLELNKFFSNDKEGMVNQQY